MRQTRCTAATAKQLIIFTMLVNTNICYGQKGYVYTTYLIKGDFSDSDLKENQSN